MGVVVGGLGGLVVVLGVVNLPQQTAHVLLGGGAGGRGGAEGAESGVSREGLS